MIRQDMREQEQEKLESMLLQGISSGEAKAMTKKDWRDLRSEVHARLAKKNAADRS